MGEPTGGGPGGIRRAGMDIDRNGVVWTPLASGHLASFDRRKCTGPLNGPEATGQHCPEGWTLYEEPLPKMKGITESGSSEGSYYTWVDQFDTLGLGRNVPIDTGNASEGLLALQDGEWVILRVPYPLGFYTKWLDGRIDDPDAGWKGKGIWATWSTRAPFHAETGKVRRARWSGSSCDRTRWPSDTDAQCPAHRLGSANCEPRCFLLVSDRRREGRARTRESRGVTDRLFGKKKKDEAPDPLQIWSSRSSRSAILWTTTSRPGRSPATAATRFRARTTASEEWELTSAGEQRYLERADGAWSLSRKISIGAIDGDIRRHILDHDDPPARILFKGTAYHLDASYAGPHVPPTGKGSGEDVIRWEFLDEDEVSFVGIEQWSENRVRGGGRFRRGRLSVRAHSAGQSQVMPPPSGGGRSRLHG